MWQQSSETGVAWKSCGAQSDGSAHGHSIMAVKMGMLFMGTVTGALNTKLREVNVGLHSRLGPLLNLIHPLA